MAVVCLWLSMSLRRLDMALNSGPYGAYGSRSGALRHPFQSLNHEIVTGLATLSQKHLNWLSVSNGMPFRQSEAWSLTNDTSNLV